MKHLFTLIAFLAVSLCGFAEHQFDHAAQEVNGHTVFYKLNKSTYEATVTNDGQTTPGVAGYFDDMKIPRQLKVDNGEYVDIYTVTAIEDNAFLDRKSLKSITIPNTVTSIGKQAFYGCEKLETVNFEEGSTLKTIEESAFEYCKGLQNFYLPNSVTNIEKKAFRECNVMSAFNIQEGSSLQSIGEDAFLRCYELPSFKIPNTVTNMGKSVFYDCKALSSVVFEEGSTLQTINNSTFEFCLALKNIDIPNSVKSIGEYCFAWSGLELFSPSTSSSLETIGQKAFYYCDDLKTVVIPGTVNWIGNQVCNNCKSLQNVICHALVPPVLEDKTGSEFDNLLFFSAVGASISLEVPIPAVYEASAQIEDRWQGLNIAHTASIQIFDGKVYPYWSGTPLTYTSYGMYPQYVRNFSESNVNKWNALYVPFAIDVNSEDYDIAEIFNLCPIKDTNGDTFIDSSDDNYLVVSVIKNGATLPNKPYLIRPKKAGEMIIRIKDATIYPASEEEGQVTCSTTRYEYVATGTYKGVTVAPNSGYYVSANGNLSYDASSSVSIKPNRWVMTTSGKGDYASASSETKVNIGIFVLGEDEGDATAIANILSGKSADRGTYTIDGRKVADDVNLKAGIYIKNGKKIVIK